MEGESKRVATDGTANVPSASEVEAAAVRPDIRMPRDHFALAHQALTPTQRRAAEETYLLNFNSECLVEWRRAEDARIALRKRLRDQWVWSNGAMVRQMDVTLTESDLSRLFADAEDARIIEHVLLPQLLFSRGDYRDYVVRCARAVAETPPSPALCIRALLVVIQHAHVTPHLPGMARSLSLCKTLFSSRKTLCKIVPPLPCESACAEPELLLHLHPAAVRFLSAAELAALRLVSKAVHQRVRAVTTVSLAVRMADTGDMRSLVVPCVATVADVKRLLGLDASGRLHRHGTMGPLLDVGTARIVELPLCSTLVAVGEVRPGVPEPMAGPPPMPLMVTKAAPPPVPVPAAVAAPMPVGAGARVLAMRQRMPQRQHRAQFVARRDQNAAPAAFQDENDDDDAAEWRAVRERHRIRAPPPPPPPAPRHAAEAHRVRVQEPVVEPELLDMMAPSSPEPRHRQPRARAEPAEPEEHMRRVRMPPPPPPPVVDRFDDDDVMPWWLPAALAVPIANVAHEPLHEWVPRRDAAAVPPPQPRPPTVPTMALWRAIMEEEATILQQVDAEWGFGPSDMSDFE